MKKIKRRKNKIKNKKRIFNKIELKNIKIISEKNIKKLKSIQMLKKG